MTYLKRINHIKLLSLNMGSVSDELDKYINESPEDDEGVNINTTLGVDSAGRNEEDNYRWSVIVGFKVELVANTTGGAIGDITVSYKCEFETNRVLDKEAFSERKKQADVISIVIPFFRETMSYLSRSSGMPDFQFPYRLELGDE